MTPAAWSLLVAGAVALAVLATAQGMRERTTFIASRRQLERLTARRGERVRTTRRSWAWVRWAQSDAAAALHLRWEEYWGLTALAMVAAGTAGFIVRGAAGAALLAAMAAFGSVYWSRWRRRQWLSRAEAQLPDLLRAVGTALRAGSSLPQALHTAGEDLPDPLGGELARLGRREALGFDFSEALQELAERVPSRDLELAIAAIQVQREVGGALAPLLDTVTETVEARQRLKAEVRVLTAMGRASGVVLSILPVALGLLVWFMNPAYMDLLFTTPVGHVLVGYGVLSLLVGTAVINRMVRGPEL